MTSKNLFFKLEKEEWKRKLWLAALSFLVFFFALPVGMALNLSNAAERYDRMVQSGELVLISRGESLARAAADYVSVSRNGMMAVLIIAMAVVCGAASFSYLHSKRKIDFYHSVPVKRTMLYAAAFLTGLLIPAAACGLNLVLAAGIAAGYGVPLGSLVSEAAAFWAFHMLYLWLLYSVTVLAVVMTGNLVVGLLGTVVFFTYFPAAGSLISACFSTFFKTYAPLYGEQTVTDLIVKISPASLYLQAISSLQSGERAVSLIASSTVAAAAVTAVSVLLYRKRPSEAAGKAMAFPASKPAIRIALSLLFAVCGGLFFWGLHSTSGWLVFGVAAGALLCHCIIEIIYHFDFRKLFSHKVQLAACVAAGLAVLFCFKDDWIGYDTYLPEADQISEAAVDLGVDYWISYDEIDIGEDGIPVRKAQNRRNYLFDHMKITDAEPVLEIAAKGIESVLGDRLGTEENGSRWSTVYIQYTLTSGRKVRRRYAMPLSEAMDGVKDLWQDPQYQEGNYPILARKPEDAVRAEYQIGSRGTRAILETKEFFSKEQAENLLAAYQEELRGLTIETMEKENPVAEIRFFNEAEAAYVDNKERDTYDSWVEGEGYYPVYPSFTKTLALMGITDKNEVWDHVHLEEVAVEDGYEIEDGSADAEIYGSRYVYYRVDYHDQEQMKEILQAAVLNDYLGMNWMADAESPTVHITALSENGSRMEIGAAFPKGKIPDFVVSDLAAALEDQKK